MSPRRSRRRPLRPAGTARFQSLAAPHDPSLIQLADLGIAAPVGNPKPLTRTGHHIGTLMFMAPELLDPTLWKKSSRFNTPLVTNEATISQYVTTIR